MKRQHTDTRQQCQHAYASCTNARKTTSLAAVDIDKTRLSLNALSDTEAAR